MVEPSIEVIANKESFKLSFLNNVVGEGDYLNRLRIHNHERFSWFNNISEGVRVRRHGCLRRKVLIKQIMGDSKPCCDII